MSLPRRRFMAPSYVLRANVYYRKMPLRLFTNLLMLGGAIALLNMAGGPIEGFFAAIGLACLKVTPPLLNAAGIYPDLSDYGMASFIGLFTLLLLLTLRVVSLFYYLYFSHIWSYENESTRPPGRLMVFFWIFTALVAAYIAWGVRDLPLPGTKDYVILLFLGLRLMLFYTAVSFCLMGLAIAWTFNRHRRLLMSPQVAPEPETVSAKKLDVAVAAAAAAKPPPFALPEVDGFYRALAAEMIQFTGFNGRAPFENELVATLLTLQRAAQMTTQENGIDEPVLRERCEKALALFNDSALIKLKNVKTAQSLFNKPRPGAMMELAAELQEKIGLYKL